MQLRLRATKKQPNKVANKLEHIHIPETRSNPKAGLGRCLGNL